MTPEDWGKPFVRSLGFLLGGDTISSPDERGQRVLGDAVLVLIDAHHEPMDFSFPQDHPTGSRLGIHTDAEAPQPLPHGLRLSARSLVALTQPPG